MGWVKKGISFVLLFVSSALYSDYTLCIDGGGSKTLLQVVDEQGQLVPLTQNNTTSNKIEATGSNINTVGYEGVKAVLRTLFEDVEIGSEKLAEILHDCQIVAGMAGVALPKNRQAVISFFETWGIKQSRIVLMSDAEMALQLIEGRGIILIAGTGSICLGQQEETRFRVGGLGRVLGDEGSGYRIGLEALKSAVAEEYGWGAPTSLTLVLREFFHVAELKTLIPAINLGEMLPSKIASCAPLVFKQAAEGDRIAQKVVDCAADDLGSLLSKMLEVSHLAQCEVHLWGGIFKSTYADAFIQKMMKQVPSHERENLNVINKSHDNAALLFVLKNFFPSSISLR